MVTMVTTLRSLLSIAHDMEPAGSERTFLALVVNGRVIPFQARLWDFRRSSNVSDLFLRPHALDSLTIVPEFKAPC